MSIINEPYFLGFYPEKKSEVLIKTPATMLARLYYNPGLHQNYI
jgi:hypothetical protein